MLKANLVRAERYEQSLLQLWGLEKSETQEHVRRDLPLWQQQYVQTESATGGPQAPPEPGPSLEPEVFFTQPEKPVEEFIRFMCSCGKRLKVPAAFVGKIARCPQCQKRLTIPGKRPAAPEAAPPQAQKPKEQFIRFVCPCGKRIKVPTKFAGKSGRCPRCQSQLKIPDAPGK